MLRQLVLAQQFAIRIPHRLTDGRVLDRGDAFSVKVVDALQYAVALLPRCRRRNEIDHRVLRRFLQHPGGSVRRVAVDGAGGRILGGRGNLRKLERRRIGGAVVPGGVSQPHRIVCGDRIEIGGGDIAPFGELALVPAVAQQPFAGFQCRNSQPYAPHHLGDARDVAQIHVIQFPDSAVGDVRMAVDEPRRRGPAMQIDAAGGGAGEAQNLVVGAERGDLPIANRHAFDDRILRIHREYPAVK